ncbi:MAG: hypothetical protein KA200_00265 [Burkholderiales bacterium]|nr:hypothetical protein [Burkholderiales bacterium]
MRRALLAVGALALAGCMTSTMEGVLEPWVGAPIDEVVEQWGPPSQSTPVARGRTVATWDSSRLVLLGGTGGTFSCVRQMTFDDASRRVVDWRWSGNDCCDALMHGPCKSWRRPTAR